MPKDNYATCDKCGEPIATSEDSHWEESKVFHKSCLAMPFSDAALDETRKVKPIATIELKPLGEIRRGTIKELESEQPKDGDLDFRLVAV